MAGPLLLDRVYETSITTGTGAFTLVGAVTGHRTFASAMSVGDTFPYCIAAQGGTEWEVGIGTLSAATTLTRTTVLASSNGGSAVNFSAGTKDCFLTYPAGRGVLKSGALTSGRVPYITANGELTDSAGLVHDGSLFGVGSGSLSVGFKLNILDSGPTTAGTQTIAAFGYNSTGSPATGLGVGILLLAESTTTENRGQALIGTAWASATDASRAADLYLSVYSVANEQEGLRIRANSGGVQLGFFGVTPIARPGATADIKDSLCSLGLLTNGGASPLDLDAGALSAGTGTFSGVVAVTVEDAATSTTTNLLTLAHNSSGTPATSFGGGILFQLESTTTANQNAGKIEAVWATATHAFRASDLILSAYAGASAQEGLRIRGAATVEIGAFGVAPVPRPSSTADIKDSLCNLGWLTNGAATPLNLDGGKLTCDEIEIDGALNHDGTTVGLYGVPPVVQHSSTGVTTGTGGGAGAAFRVDGTATGNIGSTAYTIGDIVACLKNLGALAQ